MTTQTADERGAFTPEQLSVAAKDGQPVPELDPADPTPAAETDGATASGAVTGGALGAVAGFLAAISAITIPGIGPVVGAGILVSTLVGAGIGATTGGLIGALVAEGVPEDEARGYEAHLGAGRLLLAVRAHSAAQVSQAQSAFDSYGGQDVRTYGVIEPPRE